jgi:Holliday junction DNA helicase RuvA
MIALLRGTLFEKHPNQIIVQTGGVGYEVVIPISTFSALPDAGSEVQLRVYTHVREDALALFGFFTTDEKAVFEKLISVSGIGPSLAIKVLSGLATADLIAAIRSGEVEQLVRIPGVGKKTAERMVLELRDKLEGVGLAGTPLVASKPAARLGALEQDVLSALLNLGCKPSSAEAAVRQAKGAGVPEEFEPLFRKALELVR